MCCALLDSRRMDTSAGLFAMALYIWAEEVEMNLKTVVNVMYEVRVFKDVLVALLLASILASCIPKSMVIPVPQKQVPLYENDPDMDTRFVLENMR